MPRTSQALGFAQYTPTDKKLYSPEELLDRFHIHIKYAKIKENFREKKGRKL